MSARVALATLATLAVLAVLAPARLATAQSVEEGARQFAKSCSRCHGPSGPEPDLSLRVSYGFSTFVRNLRSPPEGMRRFPEKELSQARACSVFLYVRSLRPGALPDPVELCGLTPPPPTPPPPPAADGEPALPPEPAVAAIDERAFLFGRAADGAFVLDCWGGDARIRVEPYLGGRWTYEVAVRERTDATRPGSREVLPWQPGECARMDAPLARRGSGSVGFLLRWRSLDRTPFASYSLSFPADVTASVFATGGTQTDMGLLLNALSSPRHRVRLRVTPASERVDRSRGAAHFERLELVDVNGFAIASTP